MKRNTVLNRFTVIGIFIYLFFYKIIIEFVYAYSISPKYGYSGLTLNTSYYKCWLSTIYLLIIVIFSPKSKSRPSTYMYIIMEFFLIVPTLSYYWLNNQSTTYTTLIVLSSIIISIVLVREPAPVNINIRTSTVCLNYIFVLYVLITLYLIIKRGGIDLRALNFDLIYVLRSENQIRGIFGYLMNWSTKTLCPFFFTYFYYKKKYTMLLPILGLQLMMHLSFGNKAFLFSIGVLVMCVYIMEKNIFLRGLFFFISGLNVVAYILESLGISDLLHRAIPYRMLFIPAQIQYQYYEFFSVRDKMYFADGIIGKIFSITSPFSEPIPLVISDYFLGSNSYSNTGIFSDAYSNGGLLLMFIVAAVFAFIIRIIDSTTTSLPLYVVVGSISYIMFVLNDTALLTTLLTGGMGLMIVLLLMFNSSIVHDIVYHRIVKSNQKMSIDT